MADDEILYFESDDPLDRQISALEMENGELEKEIDFLYDALDNVGTDEPGVVEMRIREAQNKIRVNKQRIIELKRQLKV